MGRRRVRAFLCCLSAAVALGLGGAAARADLIMEFHTEFSGAADPSGNPPWLRATFQTTGTNEVTLTIENLLQGSAEFVDEITFNLNPALYYVIPDLALTYTSGQAPVSGSPSVAEDAYKADGDGYFDIKIDYAASGDARFMDNELSVFTITATKLNAGDSFTENDFNFLSATGSNKTGLLAAAHVQGIVNTGNGTSGWIYATTAPPVPEPGTLLLLGSGLLGLAGYGRKRKT